MKEGFTRPMTALTGAMTLARLSVAWVIALGAMHAMAQDKHVHGTVNLNVAIEGSKLTVQLEAPLDSLLGFEHRPRTDVQRKAAAALLEQMKDPKAVVRPDAEAQCSLARTSVESDALAPAKSSSKTHGDKHADLEATYEFTCAQPQNLRKLDIALFDSFKRIRRVETRVAGAKGQSARTLTSRNRTVPLVP